MDDSALFYRKGDILLPKKNGASLLEDLLRN